MVEQCDGQFRGEFTVFSPKPDGWQKSAIGPRAATGGSLDYVQRHRNPRGVKAAGLADLEATPGVSKEIAQKVYRFFNTG